MSTAAIPQVIKRMPEPPKLSRQPFAVFGAIWASLISPNNDVSSQHRTRGSPHRVYDSEWSSPKGLHENAFTKESFFVLRSLILHPSERFTSSYSVMLATVRFPTTVFDSTAAVLYFRPHVRHSGPASGAHHSLSARDVLQHNNEAAQAPDQALD
jgi:hypothetical protein